MFVITFGIYVSYKLYYFKILVSPLKITIDTNRGTITNEFNQKLSLSHIDRVIDRENEIYIGVNPRNYEEGKGIFLLSWDAGYLSKSHVIADLMKIFEDNFLFSS